MVFIKKITQGVLNIESRSIFLDVSFPIFESSFCLTVHVNYLISNNGLKSEISGNKEMTPNVKEHAYLIKTRDDKRSCD